MRRNYFMQKKNQNLFSGAVSQHESQLYSSFSYRQAIICEAWYRRTLIADCRRLMASIILMIFDKSAGYYTFEII